MARLWRTVGTLALLCVAAFGVFACGATTTSSAGSPATAIPTTPPTATATTVPTATTAAPVNCGMIDEGPGGLSPANYGAITQCFATLFAHCATGTLLYTSAGADAQDEFTFSTAAKTSGCLVNVQEHYHVSSGSTPTNITKNYTCSSVTFNNNKVTIAGCVNTINNTPTISVPY
ncbi:MAG: hypothetical protein H0X24_24065 [Ktedonobacterales bacterium]|nr:hypothetical protein [Ktedonobacterales bacterium]